MALICFNLELNSMKQNRLAQLDVTEVMAGRNGFSGGLPEAVGETVRKVERSIAYMTDHLNQPLQVATLAAQANVSPSHFFALFKKRTGCPPMDYFTRLRMSHAGRLLGTTSASVKEVAAALGYDDPFYFSRVFKSVHQIPPSRYRAARLEMGGRELMAVLSEETTIRA
jgi:transcriptional regulator GlxA family with amidase domain